jgi:glycosyltransferase involved in cell wall biosynthesis
MYVVMPAYNEGPVVGKVIRGVQEAAPNARIIVIDDGSDDNTAVEAAAAGARVITLPFNCGYGAALHTGLTAALRSGADVVVTIDADGQHDSRSIERLMRPVLDNEADLVLGSRYLSESISYRVPALRWITSRCLAWLLSLIVGQRFTDTTTGFQCMNRKTLYRLVTLKDFPDQTPDADLILFAVMTGCRVREVSVTMHEDQGGQSMHGLLKSMFYVPKLFTAILSILLRYRYQKRIDPGCSSSRMP